MTTPSLRTPLPRLRPDGDPLPDLPIRTRLLLDPFLKSVFPPSPTRLSNAGTFRADGETHTLPRLEFAGPPDGGDTLRIGLFAGLDGTDRVGPDAVIAFFEKLEADPTPARGYAVFGYPVVNPTGFEAHRAATAAGHDLGVELWRNSAAPEASLLETELRTLQLHGVISLHSAPRTGGLHAFVRSSVLEKALVWPAIRAAERFLPSHPSEDNVPGYLASVPSLDRNVRGVFTNTTELAPAPFEILFETPQEAPPQAQIQALLVAVRTLLSAYSTLQSHRANL